ncbi:TolC family protein [Sporomusa acidovorans]|uniref:Outer membrane protein TolC n=1 Tax=Sporomusa acidovorans (strain ATCC 49682 / DSM 3132 / Mol) TaxID=1123286 RepID=A0ABZ3IY29_SPOA4|nr:TolC family protein [Sporomusa acidovorans]OZC22407.1 outer membrane protein TolC precursor [Sporomusa acidovorans DSM 3132]SDE48364.1 Outer membrane protein TolC [Sporomusa acidovorans]
MEMIAETACRQHNWHKKFKKYVCKVIGTVFVGLVLTQPVGAAPIALSLEDSLALALQNNADVKIAESFRDKAYWAIKQARANKNISISLTHTDTYYSVPVDISGYYSNNYFANALSLSLPLYSGGKLETQIEQALRDAKVAELNLTAAKQQLRQNVTTSYFNVLQYKKEMEVNQETVDNYTAHLKHVRDQYQIGAVAKLDVLSSQVELANAQDNLIKAQSDYAVAVASLNNMIGLPIDSEIELKDELSYVPFTATFEECIRQALDNRPEIAVYQTKITSAQADVKIAKSGYDPTVQLTLTQGWYDGDLPGLNNSNWTAGLTASMNIFDSGLNKSKVKQAEYSLTAAQEQARQQRENILLEVRQYYVSMREAEKRIDLKKVAVEQATERLNITEAQYKSGVGTNLDVFDAVLALNQAKLNNIKALYDYNTSKAQVEKAIGTAIVEKGR